MDYNRIIAVLDVLKCGNNSQKFHAVVGSAPKSLTEFHALATEF
jgi:hypothetical protein